VPPQISVGREWPLQVGDTIVLSTDGFWAQIPPVLMGSMLKKQGVVDLFPGLLTEAHRRAAGESDNLTVVAMTWEAQDDPHAADTTNLTTEQFATSSNTEELDLGKPSDDVTEEDIERAIAEIQDAIRRVPR
jgi:serine/threonine protein phosphatase PrpC